VHPEGKDIAVHSDEIEFEGPVEGKVTVNNDNNIYGPNGDVGRVVDESNDESKEEPNP